MRAVAQRVREASVTVIEGANRQTASQIAAGLLILVGVKTDDTESDARALAEKVANLRIFEDANGKMNRSLLETGGEALVVSNFTLYGDCRKGRRPSFTEAASGSHAETLYLAFGNALESAGVPTRYGVFGAQMEIVLINDGPVTLLLDSRREF
jgi:D-tyrosyl-tRNA(Tyr) deacylase